MSFIVEILIAMVPAVHRCVNFWLKKINSVFPNKSITYLKFRKKGTIDALAGAMYVGSEEYGWP